MKTYARLSRAASSISIAKISAYSGVLCSFMLLRSVRDQRLFSGELLRVVVEILGGAMVDASDAYAMLHLLRSFFEADAVLADGRAYWRPSLKMVSSQLMCSLTVRPRL